MVLPLNDLLTALVKHELPGYASSLALLFLGFLIDKIPDWFFRNGIFWRACEHLLARAIQANSLNLKQPTFRNQKPQRLRGDIGAWRTCMSLFEEALPAATSSDVVRATDAAQRVAPWTLAGGLLCTGAILAPWAWPKLIMQFHMTSVQLGVAVFMLWGLVSFLSGGLASMAAAPWIRTRCL